MSLVIVPEYYEMITKRINRANRVSLTNNPSISKAFMSLKWEFQNTHLQIINENGEIYYPTSKEVIAPTKVQGKPIREYYPVFRKISFPKLPSISFIARPSYPYYLLRTGMGFI